jgi:hypothetical protein
VELGQNLVDLGQKDLGQKIEGLQRRFPIFHLPSSIFDLQSPHLPSPISFLPHFERFAFPPCSFVPFVVKGLGFAPFPITRSPDHARSPDHPIS